ncbi:Pfs, NACHT and Ankyrin domain protein [Planoprotostelium fungivorum]|uniref:Pfs, NACHT and Ankyrin domain protein n=1 Tax=Planoprotostelium fungivorum TaxID=1890364 RepID=A0A2P6NYW9_9EUKA|nr:Pfs, NACHT and Ankyrin domain protein [Planoprotostelium fungivorum]
MPQSEAWTEGAQLLSQAANIRKEKDAESDKEQEDNVDEQKTKGKRQRASWHQKSLLERVFQTTQYPDLSQRSLLASQLGMSPRKIQIWFQNRRTKEKGKPTSTEEKVKVIKENKEDVPGTDVNIQNKSGNTLLFIAASMGHTSVSYLLSRGATQQPNHAGQTPLFAAVQNGHERVVRMLLEHKNGTAPSINLREFEFGESALHMAALMGYGSIVRTLLTQDGIQINSRDYENYTPLHHGCINGHREVCDILIAHGSDVNAKSSEGFTPLHAATIFGDSALVDHLLRNGADVNSLDSKGWSSLTFAAREGHEQVVLTLLSFKPNIETKTDEGFTPLLVSCCRDRPTIVESLMTHGAATDISTSQIQSPVHLATLTSSRSVLLLLLSRGLDFRIKDTHGKTAGMVIRPGDQETKRIFQEHFEKTLYDGGTAFFGE